MLGFAPGQFGCPSLAAQLLLLRPLLRHLAPLGQLGVLQSLEGCQPITRQGLPVRLARRRCLGRRRLVRLPVSSRLCLACLACLAFGPLIGLARLSPGSSFCLETFPLGTHALAFGLRRHPLSRFKWGKARQLPGV